MRKPDAGVPFFFFTFCVFRRSSVSSPFSGDDLSLLRQSGAGDAQLRAELRISHGPGF
jgi:hypothetical protein